MKVIVGADHGGYILKEQVKDYLKKNGFDVIDVGTFSEDSVDYPDIAKKAHEEFIKNNANLAFLFCGTGIGISISANKLKGFRAALVWNKEVARLAKEHNDANVICMGGRIIPFDTAKNIIDSFLEAQFQGGRHQRRINKISDLEKC